MHNQYLEELVLKGNLPVSTKHFDIGSSIKTDSTRLSYSLDLGSSFNSILEFKIDSIVENAISEKAMWLSNFNC